MKNKFTEGLKIRRSGSAERAIYFEKLVEDLGGPDRFLNVLNNISG